MENSPEQFIDTLRKLSELQLRETPQFRFLMAVKAQLLENCWTPADANLAVGSQQIPLPFGATSEQLDDMGYYYAQLICSAYEALLLGAHFDNPITEASLLAKHMLMQVLQ